MLTSLTFPLSKRKTVSATALEKKNGSALIKEKWNVHTLEKNSDIIWQKILKIGRKNSRNKIEKKVKYQHFKTLKS